MGDQQPATPTSTEPPTPGVENPPTPGSSTPNLIIVTQSIPTQTSPPSQTGQVIQQQLMQATHQIQQHQSGHVQQTPTPPQPNPTPPQVAQPLTPQPQLQQQIVSQLQTIPLQSQAGTNGLQIQGQTAGTITPQMQQHLQQQTLQQQSTLQQSTMQMQPQHQATLMSQLQSPQSHVSGAQTLPLQQVQQTAQTLNTQLQTQMQPGAQQLAQLQAQGLQGIQHIQTQNAAGQATLGQLASNQGSTMVRPGLPQVQLIQQAVPGANFLQQQQQQLLYAAAVQAAMQGMGTQQINIGAIQTRVTGGGSTPKSPALVAVSQSLQAQQRSVNQSAGGMQTTKMTMAASKPIATVQQQQAVFNQKQVLQRTGQQPLVIGQLGVLTNQGVPVAGNQVAQGKSSGIAVTSGTQTAMLGNQPLRIAQTTYMTNTGQLVNGNGQLLSGNQAMLGQLQAMTIQQSNLQPLANQQMLQNQGTTILSSRPVYIQAATPMQAQQGIVGNIQAVAPTKAASVSKPAVEVTTTVKQNQGTQPKTIATPGQIVKGVQQILPQPPRTGVTQAVAKPIQQTVPVHPTTVNIQTSTTRQVQVGERQVSRVQGVKAGRVSRPVTTLINVISTSPSAITTTTTTTVQPRPTAQAIGQIKASPQIVTSQPPTLVVQPKRQEQPDVENPVSPVAIVSELVTSLPVPMPSPSPPVTVPVQVPHMNGNVSQSEPISHVEESGREDDDDDDDEDDREREDDVDGEDADEEDMDTEDQADIVTEGSKVVKANPGEPNGRHPDDDKDDEHGEKQKAWVRPQVLTHVIEGFIIQEAREPFPVQRSSVMNEFLGNKPPPPPDPDDMDMADRDDSLADFDDENLDPLDMCNRDGTPDSEEDKKTAAVERKRRIEEALFDPTVKLRCEFCGKEDYPYRFKRSKRFCSMACAKRYNVGCSRHVRLFDTSRPGKYIKKRKLLPVNQQWKRALGGRVSTGPIQRSEGMPAPTMGYSAPSGDESPASPLPSSEHASSPTESVPPSSLPKSLATSPLPGGMMVPLGHGEPSSESESSLTPSVHNGSSSPSSPPELERVVEVEPPLPQEDPPPPTHKYIKEWNTQEVYQFIHTLPGCTMYADEFSRQEIDGQALMLLKEDHLMTAMNIKLGPALKICAKINALREEGS